jgi:HPt (histidine-containing phosphotransfer) domain-containing protein
MKFFALQRPIQPSLAIALVGAPYHHKAGGSKKLNQRAPADIGRVLNTKIKYGSATMNNQKETLAEPAWNHAELLERVDNDQELLRELLTIFKEDFPRTMRSLESAVAAADLKNIARLSHTLKGMLSSLGAARAAAAASRLEELASAGETAPLKGAFDALECQAASLLPELDAYMTEVRH